MSDTIPTPARTVEERLDSIDDSLARLGANVSMMMDALRAIATELGIREEVRGHLRRLDDANGHHDTDPAPAGGGA